MKIGQGRVAAKPPKTRLSIFQTEQTMSHATAVNLPKRRMVRLLPCVLGGVVLASAVCAQQQPTATAAALRQGAGALPAAYRVVNLGVGNIVSFPAINDRGQVAYTLDNGSDPTRALFYDGTTIRDLGTLGGPRANATAVNNAGQVVGASTLAGDPPVQHAFLWSRSSGMLDLGILGGNNALAVDINNRGEVTGNASVPNGNAHAFRWSFGTGIEDLGLLPGAASSGYSNATAISDSGLIAGWGSSADGFPHAFAWTRKTGMVDLGALGGLFSLPSDVDAAGQVVGYSTIPGPGNLFHAFIWNRRTGMTDLGTGFGQESLARAINDRGQVVGVIISPGPLRGFSWTRATGMSTLGTLGGVNSEARDVNDKGQVVGGSDTRGGERHAFVWTASEGMVDLNKRLRHAPAGLVLDFAYSISDNGSIVATSNAGLVLLKPDCGCTGTHTVGPVVAADMVEVGMPFESTVSFAGANRATKYNVTWSWGDGSGDQGGSTRESKGIPSAVGSYTYKAPGIYAINAVVTDVAGRSATVARNVVVYDKGGTMAYGSGMFVSPQGASGKAGIQRGMARFALIAPLDAGAQATAAPGQLRFSVGTLNFRSQTLRPLTMQGQRRQFEGTGRINGTGDYRFALTTTAGEPGKSSHFGLRISHVDPVSRAEVVDYDNRAAGPGRAGPAVQGRIVHQ